MVNESAQPVRIAFRLSPERTAVILWVGLCILSLLRTALHPELFFYSTDDAMRLAEVRDLIAGQTWFDLTQHRMNVPFGLPMHWSRLIDAPIAGLILLFRTAMPAARAETVTAWCWPLLTALPVLVGLAAAGKRLAGMEGGLIAAVLGVACIPLTLEFQPGRIDHDAVQMGLSIWLVVCLLDLPRRRAAIIAAVLSALTLGIGLETLPYVLLAALIVALCWIADPLRYRVAVAMFGLTLAAGTAVLFFGATAGFEQAHATCDDFSRFYAALALTGGLGLAACSALPPGNRIARSAAIATLAALLFGVAALIGPDCLAGPYAKVSDQLNTIWLSRIQEALPAWKIAVQDTSFFISSYLYGCATLAASLAMLRLSDRAKRPAMTMAASFAALAWAVATIETRASMFAILFGIGGMAALCVFLLGRLQNSRLSPAAGAAAVAMLIFAASDAGFALAAEQTLASGTGPPDKAFDCFSTRVIAPLAQLPPGRMAAFVDQGPAILMDTRHSVVAGPYHRDGAGIIDTYRIFTGSPAHAASVLKQRGIDYVVTCPSSPDYRFYLKNGGRNGLLPEIAAHRAPSWLKPIALSDPALQVFRVDLP